MWIKDVNFPESLLAAQKSESLVIFAGAGVSVDPPSNYPNFSDLADEIADGVLHREKQEPIDHFLGRLVDKEIEVHRRAREILSNPSSQPNPLHFDLLRLFPSASQVRLVTTNFDTHFTTAAKKVFKDHEPSEIFKAPALPLGHQFTGIVYLHGCVDQEPERLILTDRDFGRAYLTEGWARRCVHALFSAYTVLFVGYSHNDTVMNYLARGLPPDSQGRRFALTAEDNLQHWEFLNIIPVPYPLRRRSKRNSNKHRALSGSLNAWVERSTWGALEHEKRIQDIVKFPPPLDKEPADYIDSALIELPTTRFFARHVKSLEWLRWVENKQAFRSLFQPGTQVDPIAQTLASWFATNFVCQHPGDALALLQRRGQQLNPILWEKIASQCSQKDPRPDPKTLARWVTILVRNAPPAGQRLDLLEFILTECRHPDDDVSALLLFEYLTRPRLDLRPSFRLRNDQEGEQISAEVSLEGDSYWLKKSWEEFFFPNLATFVEKLEPILTHHMQHAHLLLRAANKANDLWDPLSYHRSAIEPHEQDQYERPIDVLIDATRDVLEWLLNSKPDHAHAVIDMWSRSESPLLKRLAIHGITESPRLSSDEKLVWIQERNWLYRFGLKHEIFRLLKTAYPRASLFLRTKLLEQVCRGSGGRDAEGLDEETRQYEIYNLLLWLHSVAPECDLTTEKFETTQQTHPHFEPREHPDLESEGGSGSYGPESPVTTEELLAKDPEKEIDWLLNYQEERIVGFSRVGLLETVTEAATKDYAWSWKLVTTLQDKTVWTSDLWKALLRGWQKSSFTAEQWGKILSFLFDCDQLHGVSADPIADLLAQRTRRDQETMPASCLPLAQRVAGKVWEACPETLPSERKAVHTWFQSAIDHPGGKLVEFWLHTLSIQRAEAGDEWAGLPAEAKTFFDRVLTETTYTAELGRVVLASQLHFLFSLEAEWARKNVLPLLDWSIDKRRAQQAWHGFLFWGRLHEALLTELIPLYEKSFTHVQTEVDELRDHFGEQIADIVLYSSQDPLRGGWLGKFLGAVGPSDREAWATQIGHRLRFLQGDAAQDLWNRWMRDYWQRRVTGIPLPLEMAELEKMIRWSVYLKPVFSEVVELICGSSAPPLKHTHLYRELVEKNLAVSHPEAVTRLLQHLLPKADEPFLHCHELEQLVRKLIESSASRSDLQNICNELGRLGCRQAMELNDLLEQQASDKK